MLRSSAALVEPEFDRSEWDSCWHDYRAACALLRQHDKDHYRPALATMDRELATMSNGLGAVATERVRRMLFDKHCIAAIEDRGDELGARLHGWLHRLLAAPSPSIVELAIKLKLIRDLGAVDEPWRAALVAIANDASRLADRL
ncbi:hypothetical protein GCM10023264_11670 [Sphingomonas daechungensis]